MKYIGRWGSYEDMLEQWRGYTWSEETPRVLKDPVPREEDVLFASYGGGAYEGDATVIFRANGKLYEVNGSHCSCYGLEGQWEPEETSAEALARRSQKKDNDEYGWHFLHDHEHEAYEAYWALVTELQKTAEAK